jgi:hypothetical protein
VFEELPFSDMSFYEFCVEECELSPQKLQALKGRELYLVSCFVSWMTSPFGLNGLRSVDWNVMARDWTFTISCLIRLWRMRWRGVSICIIKTSNFEQSSRHVGKVAANQCSNCEFCLGNTVDHGIEVEVLCAFEFLLWRLKTRRRSRDSLAKHGGMADILW